MTAATPRFGDRAGGKVAPRGRARAAARVSADDTGQALAVAGGVAAVTLPTALDSVAGPDLWWHVHTGHRVIASHSIPGVDDLSYTAAGQPWHNHEWLSQVLFASIDSLAGGVGLLVLRAVLFVATIGLLAVVVHRRTSTALATVAIVVPATVFAGPFLNIRPHTLTYLFLVGLVALLDRVAGGDRLAGLGIPVLFLVWANVHGGFVLGLGLLGLVTVTALARDRRQPVGVLLALVAMASAAATLANPAGFGLYRYLVSELGADHSLIVEWQPARGATLAAIVVIPAAVVGLGVLARRLPSIPLLIVFAGSVAVSTQQARFFVVVALVGAMTAAEVAAPALARLAPTRRRRGRGHAMPVLVGLGAAGAVVMALAAPGDLAGLEVIEDGPPMAAADFIEHHDLGGQNLASHLEWGGYFIARFDGDYKVALDGRNLTVYDDAWVDRYLRAMRSGELLDVDRLDATDIWVLRPASPQVAALDADPAWARAYVDSQAVVFAGAAHWSGGPRTGAPRPGPDYFSMGR